MRLLEPGRLVGQSLDIEEVAVRALQNVRDEVRLRMWVCARVFAIPANAGAATLAGATQRTRRRTNSDTRHAGKCSAKSRIEDALVSSRAAHESEMYVRLRPRALSRTIRAA